MSHFYIEDDKTRSNFNKNFFAAVKETLFRNRRAGLITLLFIVRSNALNQHTSPIGGTSGPSPGPGLGPGLGAGSGPGLGLGPGSGPGLGPGPGPGAGSISSGGGACSSSCGAGSSDWAGPDIATAEPITRSTTSPNTKAFFMLFHPLLEIILKILRIPAIYSPQFIEA